MARTRFAPSPTGSLHVGGVRTALYCWLWSKKHGSPFILRIEDTDQARSTDEATVGLLRDLRWVGLDWDEGPERPQAPYGPYLQSQRLALYDQYVEALLASGHAYEAWESGDELAAMRKAAEDAKQNFRFRKPDYSAADLARFKAEGRVPVVRLKSPGRAVTVQDRILGPVTAEADILDDLVIRKADGFPTYHFAVVIDDHLMHIELILRGQEHLMNTHKHELIYEALGWAPVPAGHLPTIANPTGGKMSKRDKAKVAREAAKAALKARGSDDLGWLSEASGCSVDELRGFVAKQHDRINTAEAVARALSVELPMIEVMDFRRAGVLPEALLNYLALLGWSPGDDREVLSLEELVQLFDIERVNKTAARFDPTKLQWMSGEYMKTLPVERLLQHMAEWLEVCPSPVAACDDAHRRLLLEMYRPRAATFGELDRMARFFFEAPTTWDAKQVQKQLLADGGAERLRLARSAFVDAPWTSEGLKEAVDRLCATTETPLGKWAQPLRVAVTGTGVSPDLYSTLVFLGREETVRRIDACLDHVGSL
jgi:glutamyl/glutaminyl-tRNA synthetase